MKQKNTELNLKSKTESKGAPAAPKIHPVIIYPFVHASDTTDIAELYKLVAELDANKTAYARPITVMDRKTYYASEWNPEFLEFRTKVIAKHSQIIDGWCADTCQMWYTGLGAAYEQGGPDDVYWLIPGDFNYGSPVGREVLAKLPKLADTVLSLQKDICIGEIVVDVNSSKRLIDAYGTWALLLTWFPQEEIGRAHV